MMTLQIIATLAYTDQFQYPLTAGEVFMRLIDGKILKKTPLKSVFKGKTFSRGDLKHNLANTKKTLDILVKEKKVIKKGPFYALVGSEKYFRTRRQRRIFSKQNKSQIKQFVEFAQKIPWVKAVAITGAQSMDNVSHSDDDIDFLVITTRDRLWLVRPLVIFFSFFKRKKALFWQKNKKGQIKKDAWCFNLWIDEDHLSLSLGRRNIYTAYEVSQVKWVFDRENIEQKFIHENEWVRDFLPNALGKAKNNFTNRELKLSARGICYTKKVFEFLNKVFYRLQFQYLVIKVKISENNASEGEAYLHLGNMKKIVYNRWRKALRRLASK